MNLKKRIEKLESERKQGTFVVEIWRKGKDEFGINVNNFDRRLYYQNGNCVNVEYLNGDNNESEKAS